MKKAVLGIFIVVAVLQLSVPGTMIYRKESAIRNGHVFYFKSAPIDPSDPFSGKYIHLSLEASQYKLTSAEEKIGGDDAFAIVGKNAKGYAEIISVSGSKPEGTDDYVKVKLPGGSFRKMWWGTPSLELPFDKFFMEESKAPEAEGLYTKTLRDTGSVTVAVVHIWKGESVVTDVRVDGKSIREVVRAQQLQENASVESEGGH